VDCFYADICPNSVFEKLSYFMSFCCSTYHTIFLEMAYCYYAFYNVYNFTMFVIVLTDSLRCFDTVGLVTGRASDLQKTGCWYVDGDDLTGVLQVL